MSSARPTDESPTELVGKLRDGDREAARKLWRAYFEKLVRLARTRLQGKHRRASDEEDVALSAIHSVFEGIEQGRFPQIASRDDLWRLLVAITVRKACHTVRDAGRQKRGGDWNLVDFADSDWVPLEQLVGREPTPEFAAQFGDEVEHLLARLEDKSLLKIAAWKLEGRNNDDIAGRLNVSERTVERKLKLIRDVWECAVNEEIAPSDAE